LLAAAVTPAGVEWVSVGDSPLYLWRGNRFTQLNEDHSLRPILREITGRAAVPPVSPGMLRAALTGGEIALIDQSAKPVPLRAGDVIVAATDGIHALNEEQIAAISTEPASIDASVLADKVIDAIRDANHPRQDNTTVATIRFGV
jgi:protein phosphatase